MEEKISPAAIIIPVGLGLGLAAIVGIAALARAAPTGQVAVALKNPPSGANKWQVQVVDWDVTEVLDWGVEVRVNNIAQVATFEIPPYWNFPLRIMLYIYHKWQEDTEWHGRQLYGVQSCWETAWGEPRPDYKEIFIPDYGAYYFNVATEEFERI